MEDAGDSGRIRITIPRSDDAPSRTRPARIGPHNIEFFEFIRTLIHFILFFFCFINFILTLIHFLDIFQKMLVLLRADNNCNKQVGVDVIPSKSRRDGFTA